MKNLVLNTRIVDLQEYAELTGYDTVKEVFEDCGVVAQEYAFTFVTTKDGDFVGRCFAPVICENYGEAIRRTVNIMVKEYMS